MYDIGQTLETEGGRRKKKERQTKQQDIWGINKNYGENK